MSVDKLQYAEPFFPVAYVRNEAEFPIGGKSIVFNLSTDPLYVRGQALGFFRSTVCVHTSIDDVKRCLVISDFDREGDLDPLFEAIKKKWTLVYDATGVERHKGVQLWRSEKEKIGDVEVNMCYAATIPLNVGLHRTHWGDRPFREIHTQILGYGAMQQYAEQDLKTLYREDPMAPGVTHEPMYDRDYIYHWHQYETKTKAVFMATEMQLSEEEFEEIRDRHR
ncbi:MAG: hypothetical protein CVV51_14240 [Spirochaetae bacterium HGW-Spirochaetae-7]|jgi:hypothetical protein|nr:MAG: hypothetical protein CVV51_14240 [Spirochaetae bacterium HGW-Spirochaetae-7]